MSPDNGPIEKISILIEKVDNLAEAIRTLAAKLEISMSSLISFQKDYYVERQRVSGVLESHEKSICGLQVDVSTLETASSDLRTKTSPIDDVKEIRKILSGNGGLGVVARLSKVEDWIAGQVWFQRLVIGAIIGQVILILLYVLKLAP